MYHINHLFARQRILKSTNPALLLMHKQNHIFYINFSKIMMLRSKVFDLMIPTDFSAFHALESLRVATVGAKRTSTRRSAP